MANVWGVNSLVGGEIIHQYWEFMGRDNNECHVVKLTGLLQGLPEDVQSYTYSGVQEADLGCWLIFGEMMGEGVVFETVASP